MPGAKYATQLRYYSYFKTSPSQPKKPSHRKHSRYRPPHYRSAKKYRQKKNPRIKPRVSCRKRDLNPHSNRIEQAPEACASANSAIPAFWTLSRQQKELYFIIHAASIPFLLLCQMSDNARSAPALRPMNHHSVSVSYRHRTILWE